MFKFYKLKSLKGYGLTQVSKRTNKPKKIFLEQKI